MGTPMKWRFALRFLLAFAVLIALWWRLDVPSHYRILSLTVVQVISPAINGWFVDFDQPGKIGSVFFRYENIQLPMLLNVQLLSMSLMPFLSLVAATPGLGWRRGPLLGALGVVLFFLVHQVIILSYPWIMDRPNFVKDTIGIFSGLVAFVVGPLGLWFVLTYSTLNSIWQLNQPKKIS
jgi:hypothetical protein